MKPTSRSIVIAMVCAAAVTGQFVGGKATRDALFLTTLSFETLPQMLIAASLCSILFVAAHARWAARIAPSLLIQVMCAASGVLFLCEWIVRFRAPAATAVLLFLHTSAMGPLVTSGFWLIATERFDPRTAKRRFGQITGAATLGGLVGALISERVAATLGAPAMLLVLSGLQFLTVWLFSQFATDTPSPAETGQGELMTPALPSSNARSSLRVVADAPHLQLLAVLVLLGSTAAALLDYLFKARAIEAVGAGDQLLRFFALYYAAISLVTFVLQVVSSRVALERFGVALTTSTPSIALLAGSIGGVVVPGFASVAAARAGESIFRGSWFRAGYELFYTPIPAEEKRAVKAIVDVGADRLGDAVGGGLVRIAALVAPAAQASAILWMAICSSFVAILAASRLNQWYVRTLGTSLVSQAPDMGRSDVDGQLTRRMLIRVRSSNRPATPEAPDDIEDARALLAVRRQLDPPQRGYGDRPEARANAEGGRAVREMRERAIAVLSRDEGLSAALVPHAIPLLAGPFSDYALFALRKVAEERIGLLTDALLDVNHDSAIRRQLARVFSICVSQRAVDGLLLALDDQRFDVRFQCAKALAAVLARNPRLRIDRDRVLEVVLREAAVGRPVWESRRQLEDASNGLVDDFVRDRAGQSLTHIFTLLSLVLPSQPLQIAFQSLHSENGRLRGTALEYLEGVLPADIRHQVWPFLVRRDITRPSQPQDEAIASLLRKSSAVTVASY
jgi:hypothetical protein